MEFKKNSTSHYLPCNYQQNNRSVLFICLALKLKRNCHLGFNKLNLTWHLIKSLYLFLFISSWLMYEIGYNIIITYLHSKKGAYSKSIFQGDKIWCTSKINDAMQFSYSEHIKLKRRVLKTGHLYIQVICYLNTPSMLGWLTLKFTSHIWLNVIGADIIFDSFLWNSIFYGYLRYIAILI